MTLCSKCKKNELSPDGVCDLCYLVDEIFRVCGPEAVADTKKACEMMKKVRR